MIYLLRSKTTNLKLLREKYGGLRDSLYPGKEKQVTVNWGYFEHFLRLNKNHIYVLLNFIISFFQLRGHTDLMIHKFKKF